MFLIMTPLFSHHKNNLDIMCLGIVIIVSRIFFVVSNYFLIVHDIQCVFFCLQLFKQGLILKFYKFYIQH